MDLVDRKIYQGAREVKTKFSKIFETFFFPAGKEIKEIVVDWVNYLRNEKLWGNDDPLFPATQVAVGEEPHFLVTESVPTTICSGGRLSRIVER